MDLSPTGFGAAATIACSEPQTAPASPRRSGHHHPPRIPKLESTRLITDSSGSAVGSFSYNPYGTLTGSTGTAISALGYAGEYTDPATGLTYNQARWYDPGTGQFMVVDPEVRTTTQPYAYANDDPIVSTDPGGTMAPTGAAAPGSVLDTRAQILFDDFWHWGLTEQQSAGLVGNLVVESDYTLSPHQLSLACGTCGRGIGQWDPTRWAELKKFAQSQQESRYSLDLQAKFVWHELNSKPVFWGLRALKKTTTVKSAPDVVMRDYERPSYPQKKARETWAQNVYNANRTGSG